MSEENMKVWNAVKQPPPTALKQIQGGRLKGKTDINPQWRYQAMTEQFGMCGEGWGYEVVRVWSELIGDGQVFAFAEVKVWVNPDFSIPGIGGSMLVEKESSGLHANDEGYKMAITDALSVALKMLGVGANIYAGLQDGSKYVPPTRKPSSKLAQAESEASEGDLGSMVFKDAGKLKTAMKELLGMTGMEIAATTAGNLLNTEKGRQDCWINILKGKDKTE